MDERVFTSTISTAQKTYCVAVTKVKGLTLLAVHRENKAKHINICGQNTKFVVLKQMLRATTIVIQKITIYKKCEFPPPFFFFFLQLGLGFI